MKRRGVQIIAGLLTASMLALTGCGDILSAADSVIEIEEFVQPMERNETTMVLDDQVGRSVNFKTLDDLIDSLDTGTAYARIRLKGYDGEVLMITDEGPCDYYGNTAAYQAHFYTRRKGMPVKCIGALNMGGDTFCFRLNDGILFAGTTTSYETYLVSDDGDKLVRKDCVVIDDGTKNTCSGTVRAEDLDSPETKFKGTEADFYKLLNKFSDSEVIEFEIKE